MFNNRRIARPINPAILERNDINSLKNSSNRSLEQRIALRHENYIQGLKNKLAEVEAKIGNVEKDITVIKSEETEDPRVDSLKTQCEMQKDLLKQYEDKLYAMVGYIKRLEQGLEKVKDLLTNNTNTADTIDKIPEFEEEVSESVSEPVVEEEVSESVSEPVVEEEVSESVSEPVVEEEVSEDLSVEKVKEDGVVDESVSLEIIEEEKEELV